MQNKQISDIAVRAILSNNKLMGLLMGHFDRGQATIENYLDAKNPALIEPEPLQIIKKESGLFESQIVEDVPVSEIQESAQN